MKSRKIVVISNKGGVGKTTSSNELFAPFLAFENSMRASIVYEFDEENMHGAKYINSDCVRFSPQKVTGINLEERLITILLDESHAVIDIGSNKSTTYFLDALEKSGLDEAVSLVAIPLSDGEQDSLNARNIYRKVRAMNREIPIIFILSRYNKSRELEYQFDYFFESVLPYVEDKDKNWIVMNDSDTIKFARREGKTIFELSYEKRDYKEQMKNALKNMNSPEQVKELSRRVKLYKNCIEYRKDILTPAFNKLKEIINRGEM